MTDDLFEISGTSLSEKQVVQVMTKPQLGYSLRELIEGSTKTITAKTMRGTRANNRFHVWNKKDRHYVRDLVNALNTLYRYNLDTQYLSIMNTTSSIKSSHRLGYKPSWIEFIGGLIAKFKNREDLSTTQINGLNSLLVILADNHSAFANVQEIDFH